MIKQHLRNLLFYLTAFDYDICPVYVCICICLYLVILVFIPSIEQGLALGNNIIDGEELCNMFDKSHGTHVTHEMNQWDICHTTVHINWFEGLTRSLVPIVQLVSRIQLVKGSRV